MNLTTYYDLISNESKARKYLLVKCFKNHQRFCPRCNRRKLYKLSDERYRCSRCEYTFHDFSGRWINQGRLSCVQLLSLIKLFELEVSVRKMSQQTCLSYRAVYRAVSAIRLSILSHAKDAEGLLGGEIEIDESYFGGRRKGNRGRGAAGKIPVFGILERGGKVRVEVVQNVTGESLLEMAIKKVKRGSLIYTDKFRSYNGLISYGFRHMRIDHGKRFVNGKVYINGIEGFWSFAKERLMKYHGV